MSSNITVDEIQAALDLHEYSLFSSWCAAAYLEPTIKSEFLYKIRSVYQKVSEITGSALGTQSAKVLDLVLPVLPHSHVKARCFVLKVIVESVGNLLVRTRNKISISRTLKKLLTIYFLGSKFWRSSGYNNRLYSVFFFLKPFCLISTRQCPSMRCSSQYHISISIYTISLSLNIINLSFHIHIQELLIESQCCHFICIPRSGKPAPKGVPTSVQRNCRFWLSRVLRTVHSAAVENNPHPY